jgi:NitT/TauT family transport system substrate-binding protein
MVRQDSTRTPGPGCNGATVAINRLNNLQAVLMTEWLEMHGGDPRTLNFREVAFQDMGDALQDGSVDVILPTEPFGTIYSSFGKFIGNAFEGIGPRFMLLGWFATEGWLAAHPDEAQRFAGAMRQASEWANGHRDESAQMLANQPHTRVTVELARRMVRATYGLGLDPAMIAPVLKLATKVGLLTAPLAAGDLIWPVASP